MRFQHYVILTFLKISHSYFTLWKEDENQDDSQGVICTLLQQQVRMITIFFLNIKITANRYIGAVVHSVYFVWCSLISSVRWSQVHPQFSDICLCSCSHLKWQTLDVSTMYPFLLSIYYNHDLSVTQLIAFIYVNHLFILAFHYLLLANDFLHFVIHFKYVH